MTTVKTRELTGPALDWAVAKCEGVADTEYMRTHLDAWPYSSEWTQGGPIIEREGINVGTQRNEPGFRPHPDRLWHAQMDTRVHVGYGPTPLIAAMRCFCCAKFGDEIDIPEELCQQQSS